MGRRGLVLLFIGAASRLFAGSKPTWEQANFLAAEYSKWAELRNARVSDPRAVGTISLPEFQQWQRVKQEWRKLEKSVDAEYRGER